MICEKGVEWVIPFLGNSVPKLLSVFSQIIEVFYILNDFASE